MSIADIKKMPYLERVHLMEQIWDTLKDESQLKDSPDWHEDVLKKRKKAIENGDVKLYSIAELKEMQKLGRSTNAH